MAALIDTIKVAVMYKKIHPYKLSGSSATSSGGKFTSKIPLVVFEINSSGTTMGIVNFVLLSFSRRALKD